MITSETEISLKEATNIYKDLILPRRIEEKMLTLLRQGKITKWFSGIGQEAIAVGTGRALHREDFILPMHRNLGLFTSRGISLYRLFCQWLGKADGFTRGRDRSFHFGSMEHNIVGMISHLAANLPVANGLALATKLKQENRIALAFCGDGATSEGDFHEALNLAAVWELPAVFLIENNSYGLSTPVSEQYACRKLVDRAIGYGMKGYHIDGNNIFEVMETITKSRNLALAGQPVLIEADTFRMRGHEEASGTFYIPHELFDKWADKDPIDRFESWLLDRFEWNNKKFDEIKNNIDKQFSGELQKALEADEPDFDPERELGNVFHPSPNPPSTRGNSQRTEKRFIDALKDALEQTLREDDTVLVMGQDIAEYGGVFKATEGFFEQFGKERIRNTPIIESGAVGAALGLALHGFKPVLEMQFADFISCGFNQIINNLAKGHYRWMPPLNITIRAPHGAGVGAGPFHSESPEGWFMQHPGLKILVPSNVQDAQDMLYSALQDPNPVLLFEHKNLYRSLKEQVTEKANHVSLYQAKVVKTGSDLTIITYGLGVHWAVEAAEEFDQTRNAEIEVVDLRSLNPLDFETVHSSIAKTNKALLLQEPSSFLGPMSEVAAQITEYSFEELDAPVMRCSSLDTPVPFNKILEKGYLAESRLHEKIENLLSY